MPGPKSRTHNTDKFLSLREAADRGYAGYSTLRKYVADGRLPAQRLGTRIRLRQTDLDALLTNAGPDPVEAAIEKLVASAPPLTPEQTRRLRDLLGEAS